MAEHIAEILDWDSRFFGIRIGRACVSRLSEPVAEDLKRWCQHHRIDCLYLLAEADDPHTFYLASAAGFELIDIRITLHRKLMASEAVEGSLIRSYRRDDLPALHEIASRAHANTRFTADPRFSRQTALRLYGAWIDRDAAEGMVLVAEDRGRVVGYVTGRLRNAEAEGEIGVLAVETFAQGRGLGHALLNAILGWFNSCGAVEVFVVTQGRNIDAQRLYQSSGFLTISVQLWYHLWPQHTRKACQGS